MRAFTVVWENLERYVVGVGPVSDVITEVIEICAAERPHRDWEALAALDWEDGALTVQTWVRQVLETQAPPAATRGLWFGLCTPVEGDRARSDLYLGATREYDADDRDLDWASIGLRFPGSHPRPACLAEMYRIAYDDQDGLKNDAEWPLALAFGCAAVARSLRAVAVPADLADEPLGVVCGFEGGDFIFLGELGTNGFDARPRAI